MPEPEQDVLAVVPIASSIQDHRLVLTLSGRTVLDWTLSALRSCPRVARIVVATERHVSRGVRSAVQKYSAVNPVQVVEASSGRIAAIAEAVASMPECNRVLIHDPDRPLLSSQQFMSLLALAENAPVAVPAVLLKSTFKQVHDSQVEATVPRNRLLRLQTPRIFDRRVLESVLAMAAEQGWQAADELSLVRQAAVNVHLLPGDYFNIPLSDRLDVEFVELAIARHLLPALAG